MNNAEHYHMWLELGLNLHDASFKLMKVHVAMNHMACKTLVSLTEVSATIVCQRSSHRVMLLCIRCTEITVEM